MSEPKSLDVTTHPAVAALAAALQQDDTGLFLPEEALRTARSDIQAHDEEALVHLCAWLGQVYEAAPDGYQAVQRAVLAIVWDALGAEAAAKLATESP
jgi:hypothetical protein